MSKLQVIEGTAEEIADLLHKERSPADGLELWSIQTKSQMTRF